MKEFMREKEAEQAELEKVYKETKMEEEQNLRKQTLKPLWGFSKEKVATLIPELKLKEY
jgi:hypothetical protein